MITAVIPTYNRPQATLRALDSVLKQSTPCSEIIVVNDCSTDETHTTLEAYVEKHPTAPIQLIHLSQNVGVSGARNHGIRAANHPWIALLDSDDEWDPQKLEKQMLSLKNSNCLISHTNEIWMRNGKNVKQKSKHQKYGGSVYSKAIHMCFIGPSTSIIHKSVFEKVGLFDEDFKVCEDYDFWLRSTPYFQVDYVDQPLLIKHGGHEDQLSTAYRAMDYWRALALKKQILNNKSLSSEDLESTASLLQTKISILLNGCEKHGNNELKSKIETLIKETSQHFNYKCGD